MSVTKSEVVWILGVVGAIATYLSQHGLTIDIQSAAAVGGILFAWFKSSPFNAPAAK